MNRCTAQTLTEAFIRKLESEEQQEACNALNRRTEFRVLRTTYGLPGRSNTGKATSPAKPEETETKTDETARTESDSEKN